jgi:hypothetical protein
MKRQNILFVIPVVPALLVQLITTIRMMIEQPAYAQLDHQGTPSGNDQQESSN